MIQIQNFILTHRTQGRGFSQGVCQEDFSSSSGCLDRLRDFPTTSGSDFDNGAGDRDDDQDGQDCHKDHDFDDSAADVDEDDGDKATGDNQ